MIATVLALTTVIALSPSNPYTPDPAYPTPSLIPNYVTNGDGTRMQCTPNLNQCWPDTTGLPSYLTGS